MRSKTLFARTDGQKPVQILSLKQVSVVLDAVIIAGVGGFSRERLRTPLVKCSMFAPTCMLNEAPGEICV